MGIEIEKKFLINRDVWDRTVKPQGQYYRQGYISTDPLRTIRVRLVDTHGYLTIKGLTVGATRNEFEYQIPEDDANELLNHFAISDITKIRYKISYEGKVWEIDEFLGDNEGLILAEIELASETEHFATPAWIDKEVTGDERYYNSNLSLNPYKKWLS